MSGPPATLGHASDLSLAWCANAEIFDVIGLAIFRKNVPATGSRSY
jgi:hypothetical protein